MKCEICGRRLKKEKIYGFYPEDSTYICKECFGNNKENKVSEEEKNKTGSRI